MYLDHLEWSADLEDIWSSVPALELPKGNDRPTESTSMDTSVFNSGQNDTVRAQMHAGGENIVRKAECIGAEP